MTDLPAPGPSVPGRLGTVVTVDDDQLHFHLAAPPEALHHGMVRASVYVYLVDVAAGNLIDDGDNWTLTTDLSFRARPVPAPALLTTTSRLVRDGKRSLTTTVDIRTDDDVLVASGAVGFVRVPRRPTDPVKPSTTPEDTVARFASRTQRLSEPLRDEAEIRSVDPDRGVVEVEVASKLLNANGTLQGAMVGLVAEAAAEDLVQHRFGVRAVVTELDLRYLNRIEGGTLRTSCRFLGDEPTSPIEVLLHDATRDRTTTHAYARASIVEG